MTRPSEPVPEAIGTASPASTSLRALLWSGAVLCLLGIGSTRLWEQWAGGRFAELVLLALASVVGAWPLRRFARWSWASALALVWLGALALFAGPLPLLAVALLALAASALGGMMGGAMPLALACTCGLALSAGILGWLLPLPIHFRWTYLAICLVLIGVARGWMPGELRSLRNSWSAAVSRQPVCAAWAVLALGLASTGCWLPTMQFDDLAYHLRLPWELMENARYRMDPSTHAWVFGPWLGDVLQAFAQVIAGTEARGAINALWITLAAAGVWHLTSALGGTTRGNWISVMLYASLPLTAGLAGGMQTESATAALLVWLAVVAVRDPDVNLPRPVLVGAILMGGLVALKLTGAAFALLLLPLALWRHRRALNARDLFLAMLLVVLVGGSSYVYAAVMTGNPVFPLFNQWFKSPHLSDMPSADLRWHAGFNVLLPWNITFNTDQYQEISDGGAGFVLVALSGAWLLAVSVRRTLPVALVGAAMLALPLIHLQYLRYVFPALVLLVPALVVATERTEPRRGSWLLAALCLLNLAFQANANWMQRTGALKQTVLALGNDRPLFEEYAPERLLIAQMRESGTTGKVLAMDGHQPRHAELGADGRTIAAYDPAMMRAAIDADRDPTGMRWAAVWRREGISDLIVRLSQSNPARNAALGLVGAQRRAQSGDAEWWYLPDEAAR